MQQASAKSILKQNAHRAFPVPGGPWVMYQDWQNVLFFHWPVKKELLLPFIPKGAELDLFDGGAWVSIIAFSVKNAHPRFCPTIPFISHFNEVNFRTYVKMKNVPGITFLDIKADDIAQVFLNNLVGLPYKTAKIHRQFGESEFYRLSAKKQCLLNCSYNTFPSLIEKTTLDKWLTERYFNFQQVGKGVYKYPIHHKKWPLQQVTLRHASFNYWLAGENITTAPPLVHYAKEVNVLFWLMKKEAM